MHKHNTSIFIAFISKVFDLSSFKMLVSSHLKFLRFPVASWDDVRFGRAQKTVVPPCFPNRQAVAKNPSLGDALMNEPSKQQIWGYEKCLALEKRLGMGCWIGWLCVCAVKVVSEKSC